MQETKLFTLPVKKFLTPDRLDICIKLRLFQALHGGTGFQDAAQDYKWMITERVKHRWEVGLPMDGWKFRVDDYVYAAQMLYHKMAMRGFNPNTPIQININEQFLTGSHRIACALALYGPEFYIPCTKIYSEVCKPPWDSRWFAEKKAPAHIWVLIREFSKEHGLIS